MNFQKKARGNAMSTCFPLHYMQKRPEGIQPNRPLKPCGGSMLSLTDFLKDKSSELIIMGHNMKASYIYRRAENERQLTQRFHIAG